MPWVYSTDFGGKQVSVHTIGAHTGTIWHALAHGGTDWGSQTGFGAHNRCMVTDSRSHGGTDWGSQTGFGAHNRCMVAWSLLVPHRHKVALHTECP